MKKIETKNYAFTQNLKCEYFPCHKKIKNEDFNCLFCFCPLYALGENCGGNFNYDNDHGVKDCSNCLMPHHRNSYDKVMEGLKKIVEITKKEV